MALGVCLTAACRRADTKSAERAPELALFTDVAASTGLSFHHFTGASGKRYMAEIMGPGAGLLDYDNDGDLDVLLLQGKPLDGRRPEEAEFPLPAGERLGHRLYRNELVPSGALRFTDVTAQAGVGHVGYGMGVATGDYDNDGDVDLYVTHFGPNVLYRNEGNGTFRDVTREAGAGDDRWSSSAAFVDYDRDGRLDLFVLHYVDFTVATNKTCRAPTGELDYCTPKAYRPVAARLLHNEGGGEGAGRFRDVTATAGITKALGPGLGITTLDANGDGWVDLYVANDAAANHLWVNQKDGTFLEAALESGAAYGEDGVARAGMGVSAGDFDNDADDDLFVVNLTGEGATLHRQEGRGNFQDVTLALGLRPPTLPGTGFGTNWFDYDNDGWLDLFVANGAVTLLEPLRGERYPFHQKNLLLHNEGGTRFRDVTGDAGAAMQRSEVSRGAAFGDVDNDGDVDVLVTNNNGPVRLLRNEAKGKGNWLTVRLTGTRVNRMALGARVGVERQGLPTLWRRCHVDSSYLSASDARVHVGLGTGEATGVMVEWGDGTRERFGVTGKNKVVTLTQGTPGAVLP